MVLSGIRALCWVSTVLIIYVSMTNIGLCYPEPGPTHSSSASNLSINGTVFEDLDRNGFLSDDEPGLPLRTIRLMQNGTEVQNTTSDEQGQYFFHNLAPGLYQLVENSAPSWNQTAPSGGDRRVLLTDKSALRLDFGNLKDPMAAAIGLERSYPLMRPTPDEADRWVQQYESSSFAALNPKIAAELAEAPGISFSLLDYLDYSPSNRNQGSCGNCWAWAGTGVMEIDNARQNGVKDRLSVQYLNSNYNGGGGSNWACCGGWLSDVSDFYSETGKAIPWKNANAQWQDGTARCEAYRTRVPASQISTQHSYPLVSIRTEVIPTRGVGKQAAISNIKNVLRQGKAVWFGFFLPDSTSWSSFFNFLSTKTESTVFDLDFACKKVYNYAQGGGHAVLCVGYNDTDPNNSYWIMLNSWGAPRLRPQGLFRVNMDMNYDCSNSGLGYAFYWMTLDMSYPASGNKPPNAPTMPDGPSNGYVNRATPFKTSASDPDGDQIKYVLDWGDQTTTETGYSNPGVLAAYHTWTAKGKYDVKAKAIDSKGASSAWSRATTIDITVPSNPPETPTQPSGTAIGYAGSPYSFTTSSRDQDGDTIKYTFDWNDGTTSETGMMNSGSMATSSHVWNRPGTYRVKARATDSNGDSSDWSSELQIVINVNHLPQVPPQAIGPVTGRVKSQYIYSFSATDSDGDDVAFTVDWGDGTKSQTPLVGSGKSATSSHIWQKGGMFLVKAKATDKKDASSPWSLPLGVKIASTPNSPPGKPSKPAGPARGLAGNAYYYSSFTSDANRDRIKYSFDWGDGTTSQTDFLDSGKSARLSHVWKKIGIYQVKVTANDIERAMSPSSGALTVKISQAATNSRAPPAKRYDRSSGTCSCKDRKRESLEEK